MYNSTSMDAESVLQSWRDRHCKGLSIRNSTITCGLPSVLRDTSVPKPCCNKHHTLTDVIDHSCECVSGLKVRASLFILWYVYDCLENQKDPPIINTKLFTQAFSAIRGDKKKTPLQEQYPRYKKEVGISDDFHQVAQLSQILEHTKIEMMTVYKTCISVNFRKRIHSVLRWELFDCMKDDTLFRAMKKGRNENVAKLVDRCVNCVQGMRDMSSIEEFSDIFSVQSIQRVKQIVLEHIDAFNNILDTAEQNVIKRKQDKKKTAIARYGEKAQDKQKNKDVKTAKTKRVVPLLDQVLSTLPHLVLPYQYWARKRLERLTLTKEYVYLCAQAKEDKGLWKTWFWGSKVRLPQFKLLPIFHTKKHFIRIDKRQLTLWGFNIEDNTDKWWCTDIFDVYSKAANIRPLRRYSDFSSPTYVKQLMELVGEGDDKLGPYLPGSSVQTDGLQFKVPILSLRHMTPNLNRLFERGYSGIPKKPKCPVDITFQSKGVFRACACRKLNPEVDRPVIPIDPGRKEVVCYCKCLLSDIYSNREETCQKLQDKCTTISNKEYHNQTGSTKAQDYECQRRKTNKQYQKSINEMENVTHRTCNPDEILSYAKKRLEYETIRESELYSNERRGLKFYVFRKQQKAIANFVRAILGDTKNGIVLFGDGTFSPGGYGYASVPKKKFIREFAQFAVVVLVDEYCTSKFCPTCFSEVEDIDSDDTSKRLRVCPTNTGGSPCFKADRDSIGSINILQKGVFTLCGNPLSAFERA